MLPKLSKVPKDMIPLVLKKGFVLNHPLLSTRILNTKNDKKSLFLVIISKKVSNKAVIRNLIKRRVYSVIESYLKNLKPGFLVIFLPQKSAEKASFKDLKSEVESVLTKNGLIE